jgi:hypothetical protein
LDDIKSKGQMLRLKLFNTSIIHDLIFIYFRFARVADVKMKTLSEFIEEKALYLLFFIFHYVSSD